MNSGVGHSHNKRGNGNYWSLLKSLGAAQSCGLRRVCMGVAKVEGVGQRTYTQCIML